jgi:HlyD family secretion protein
LDYYLSRPYASFVEASPSKLIKHVLDDASSLGAGIIYPLIQILSKSIMVALISVLLIIIDYKIFLSSFFILTIIYAFIYKNFTSIAKRGGEERFKLNDDRFKITRDVFNSLKEVKFYSIEKYYQNNFSKSAEEFALIDAKISYYSTIPKYVLEVIIFGVIFSSIIYLIYISSPLTIHLPLIGVFILAAYRAIPMLQNIYSNINIYKLYLPAFDLIENIILDSKKLVSKADVSITKFELNKNIVFDNISFGYSNKNLIIKDLSFKIYANKMTAIIGSTGQGKTTLIDLLLGFYSPNSGNIYIDDISLNTSNRASLNKVIGYVPQTINLQEGSLSSNIALGLKNNSIDYDLIKEIVEILELTDLVSNLKNNIHSNIGDRGVKLSGGQRQRLGIARALYLNPKILILDESTNELDSKTESNIFSKIKQKYPFITIIMITHRLSSLKLADNVMLLKDNSMHKVDISDITDIEQLEKTIEACN